MLRVIKKTRIHEEVVTQIHELIREGRLKAGDQLPSERELAETFQVSRASVREALRALETHGLIISRTGMGNFIADLPVESLVAPLAKLLTEEKNALADIFVLPNRDLADGDYENPNALCFPGRDDRQRLPGIFHASHSGRAA